MVIQKSLDIHTKGRGTTEITSMVNDLIDGSSIRLGLCNLYITHTSASLIMCENVDPTVRSDLETFMQNIAPDGDPMFHHIAEGPDDMAAHTRSILTDTSITIPIKHQRCILGTWQGIYLWEHRTQGHQRHIIVTLYGE
jgi:secondary thiamine-phosphate synthase enzyme